MEWIRPIREKIWWGAGFGSLRAIRFAIEEYEPLAEITVVPLETETVSNGTAHHQEPAAEIKAVPRPTNGYYSAAKYRELYLSGELTPTDVAHAILPLIRRDIEPKGSHHLAWIDSKVDIVLQSAAASTERYKEGRSLGPLDGVPCGVKDEYDMDGYRTTLGSANDYTPEVKEVDSMNSWCIQKLLEAGVIIVGKTSMVEFGLDTPGNNPVFGTPPNPYNPDYYTGGSSSGTASAVSSGLIPMGLGSDGGGSIRIPSSMCGVFGIKPTHNRISFRPGHNHSNTCATLGPIAADIESLATLLNVIAAPHPSSPFARSNAARLPPLPKLLAPTPNRPKILGICPEWFENAHPAVLELCKGMVDTLVTKHGYTVQNIEIPFLPQGQVAHAMTVLTDAATLLPDTSNLTYGNRIMLALGRVTPATDYLLAQKLRRVLAEHLSHLWKIYPGMMIITPTTACAGWRIGNKGGELRHGISDGDKTIETMRYVWMGNFIGLPSITVPAGYVVPQGQEGAGQVAGKDTVGKLPVGLMATGEWCSEKTLLEFGLDAEVAGAGLRVKPASWVDVVELAKTE